MATIGSRGTYAQIEAPKDNILESMQYVDQLDYRAKQDHLKAQEAKAKAQKEKDEAMATDLEKIKAVPIGKRGYDAPVIEAANLLRKQYANNYRDLNSGKLSKTEFEIKKNNIFSQVDLMKQKSQSIIDKTKTLSDMLKEGKLEDGFEEKALKLGKSIDNGHIYTELDADGNVNMIAYDVDENGNKTIVEKSSLADFGNSSLNPITRVNYQKEIEDFKKNNTLGLVESLGTNTKIGIKELKKGSNIDKNIEAFAEAKVSDPNALSVAYRNATGNFETDIKDPEKIKIAKDWIYNQTFNSYAKEINVDEATQRSKLALDRQERADKLRKEQEDKPTVEVVETPPSYGEAGIRPKSGYKTVSIGAGKQVPIQQISLFRYGKQHSINSAYLNSYTVVQNPSGKRSIVAEITYPDFKSSTLSASEQSSMQTLLNSAQTKEEADLILSKATKPIQYKTEIIPLTEKDAYKFAPTVGAKDVNEMKDKARVISREEESKGYKEETKEERLARMKAELNK